VGPISSSDAHPSQQAPAVLDAAPAPLAEVGPGAQAAPARWSSDAVLQAHPDWVVRAQDGYAADVLAEVEQALRVSPAPRARAAALYVQALCLMQLGETPIALMVARETVAFCREQALTAGSVRARALLVELLRREGQLEQAVEQLAHAVAGAAALTNLLDQDAQSALGALVLAHRLIGVSEGAAQLQRRLASVAEHLPRHQQVARLRNLAFESAEHGVRSAQRSPSGLDRQHLDEAVATIERAARIDAGATFRVVGLEKEVLGVLPEALFGDPAAALVRLREAPGARQILDRGPEAADAQVFWAICAVRALTRLGRTDEAVGLGGRALAVVHGHAPDSERQVLAHEVMRAEQGARTNAAGTIEYLALVARREQETATLLDALFRARVDLLRGADERRVLARAARLDPLTNLVNRRGGADAVAEAAALPAGEQVALLLIDLDGFKEINDSRGHQAGDVKLQEVSAALRTAARVEDVVARWGGDEFVVVAMLEESRALALAERLLETIRTCHRPAGAVVSASIGVAARTDPVDEQDWLRRADEAMYAAKRAGGNAAVLG